MIGIIAAMNIEAEGLEKIMENTTEKKIGDMSFVSGGLCGCNAVVAVCGEGKVNAAMCTQAMISEYKVSAIINTGVGGGIAPGLEIGNIVVADSVVQHDMDMSPLGYEVGYICGIDGINMSCDEKLKNILYKCVCDNKIKCQTGVVASGDQFISSDEKKKWLREKFCAAVCEMEGGAIGHVCTRNKIPFAIIRAISDGGDESAKLSFPEFATLAAENSIKVMKQFLFEVKDLV